MLADMNDRAMGIFKLLVDSYLTTGEPVGSRTLSKLMGTALSPASIRNVMADLEEQGLLYAPHTSAGRMPTESGLRLFVDALMEVGTLEARPLSEREHLGAERGCCGEVLLHAAWALAEHLVAVLIPCEASLAVAAALPNLLDRDQLLDAERDCAEPDSDGRAELPHQRGLQGGRKGAVGSYFGG